MRLCILSTIDLSSSLVTEMASLGGLCPALAIAKTLAKSPQLQCRKPATGLTRPLREHQALKRLGTSLICRVEVKNSRVSLLWNHRNARMGRTCCHSISNVLSATIFSQRRMVIRFRPPDTSPKCRAPSSLNSDRQRISAASVNTRCAHGKTENRWPPRG